MTPASSEFSEI